MYAGVQYMKHWAKHCGIALSYAVLTCGLLWPLPLHLSTGLVAAESGDPLMQIWVVQWNIHKLSTSLGHYFDANIFYPYANTFAFHDHMFGLGLLGWPVQALARNPILTHNALLLLSFFLSAYAMYWLAKSICRSDYAAWIAGLLFGFLPYRFAHLDHLNLISVYWLPLCLLFLTRVLFSRTGTLGPERLVRNLLTLAGFWGCFLLQALTSFNYLFMTAFAIAVYALTILALQLARYRRVLVSARMSLLFVIGAGLAGLALLPFGLPYLRANRDMGFQRTLDEAQALAAHPRHYLAAPADNLLYGRLTQRFQAESSPFPREQMLFPGVVAIVLAGIGLVGQAHAFTRSSPRQRHAFMILGSGQSLQNFSIIKMAFFVLLLVAVLLSFGPSADLFGKRLTLPYAYLYRYVPGFNSMRVPARFGLLAAFALSMLAAVGVAYLHTFRMCRRGIRHSPRYFTATLLVGALIVAEFWSLPQGISFYPGTAETIPREYQWLAGQPADATLLELPADSPKANFEYTYYAAFHQKRLVNGRSAFIPAGISQVLAAMRRFPQPETIQLLQALGVEYVVVHAETADQAIPDGLPDGVEVVEMFGKTAIVEIPDARHQAAAEALRVEALIPDHLHPAETYRIPVLAQSTRQEPFSALPHERIVFRFQWLRNGEAVDGMLSAVRLPILFRPGEAVTLPCMLHTPDQPGAYQLVARTDAAPVEPASRSAVMSMTLTDDAVDSRQPRQLRADFLKIEYAESLPAGQPLTVRLLARNTGDTIWKAHVENRRQPAGEVHLGVVRWVDKQTGTPLPDQGALQRSRGFVPYDVAPGQEAVFSGEFRTPDQPGAYRLELNLVSELIQWFPQEVIVVKVTLY